MFLKTFRNISCVCIEGHNVAATVRQNSWHKKPLFPKQSWFIAACRGICALTLSLLRVINVKFLLQSHQKYNITQYGELVCASSNCQWLEVSNWQTLYLNLFKSYVLYVKVAVVSMCQFCLQLNGSGQQSCKWHLEWNSQVCLNPPKLCKPTHLM